MKLSVGPASDRFIIEFGPGAVIVDGHLRQLAPIRERTDKQRPERRNGEETRADEGE